MFPVLYINEIHNFICGFVPTHNCDSMFVLVTLKVATWVAETCLWLLHNKPTFTRSSAFVGIFKNIVYLLHCVIFTYCMSHLLHLGTSLEDFDTVKSFELCYFIITCISYVIRIVCCANVTVLIIIVFFLFILVHTLKIFQSLVIWKGRALNTT